MHKNSTTDTLLILSHAAVTHYALMLLYLKSMLLYLYLYSILMYIYNRPRSILLRLLNTCTFYYYLLVYSVSFPFYHVYAISFHLMQKHVMRMPIKYLDSLYQFNWELQGLIKEICNPIWLTCHRIECMHKTINSGSWPAESLPTTELPWHGSDVTVRMYCRNNAIRECGFVVG